MRQIKELKGKQEPKILLLKKKKRETSGKTKVPSYLGPYFKKRNVSIDSE